MLKMKDAVACEIYVSDTGYLVFKQEGSWPNDEQSIVMLSYEQALILRDYMPKLIEQQEQLWNGGLEEKKADE